MLNKKYYFLILLVPITLIIAIAFRLSNPSRPPGLKSFPTSAALPPTPTVFLTPSPTPFGIPSQESGSRMLEHQQYVISTSGWVMLSSNLLNLSFQYPVPAGVVEYIHLDYPENQIAGPGAAFINWFINGQQVIGGVTMGVSPQREGSYFDFNKIGSQSTIGGQVLKSFTTKYGTPARLIRPYSLGMGWEGDMPPLVEPPAVLLQINLPFPASTYFGGMAMYFPDGLSTPSAQKILDSISLK